MGLLEETYRLPMVPRPTVAAPHLDALAAARIGEWRLRRIR